MSEDRVVAFPGAAKKEPAAANPDEVRADPFIIEMLQSLVDEAIHGRIHSLAFVLIDSNGDLHMAWNQSDKFVLAGAISAMQHRFLSDAASDGD